MSLFKVEMCAIFIDTLLHKNVNLFCSLKPFSPTQIWEIVILLRAIKTYHIVFKIITRASLNEVITKELNIIKQLSAAHVGIYMYLIHMLI